MVEPEERFLGSRLLRLLLSLCVFAVLITRFGLSTDSATVLSACDILTAVISLLFLVGTILPEQGKTFAERMGEEKWLLLFSFIYVAAIMVIGVRMILGGDPASHLGTALGISYFYAFLCAVRVVLAFFGSWALDHLSPVAILPASFALVIILGTGLLMLPEATPSGSGINLVDAAFTSTSATCVTGLIVRDTAVDFTLFGQTIILLLIQVGGLGIMTFVAFFALFLGQNAGLRESASLVAVMDSDFVSDLKRIMGSIVGWTLTIECAGAFVLYLIWDGQPVGWSLNTKIWQSVFHSISAFCNAGFSLNPTLADTSAGYFSNPSNLEGFAHSPGIPLTIGGLIVLGGIGFLVLTSLGAHMLHRVRTGTSMRMSVQVKLVLWVTGILIVSGMVLFLAIEWNNTLVGMTLPQKVANSFLGSVTPRTAGFNTVPTAGILPAMNWAIVALMFIGASPGGTGGGVKTSTVGVLFMSFVSLVRKRPSTELMRRSIPSHDVKRSAVLLLLSGIAVTGAVFLLLITELGSEEGFSPFDYLYEATSAFGTVGLSTGVTPGLTWMGKTVIILTMFVGRVGPATLAAATGRRNLLRYSYPETRITIG